MIVVCYVLWDTIEPATPRASALRSGMLESVVFVVFVARWYVFVCAGAHTYGPNHCKTKITIEGG